MLNEYYRNGVLNGTVLVSDQGKVVYEKAFGLANMEWTVPNETETKSNLASVTKQFVAMLVLQQVEKGTIKLNGKIIDYLPNYPKENGNRITIHHLLNHTSGIPNYTESPDFDPVFSRTTYEAPDSFISAFSDSALQFEPGSKYTYNNSAYFLLGVILEKVTGMPFAELLKENILLPLHMDNTGMDDQYSIVAKRAAGYNRGMLGNTHAGYWDRTSLYTAGGMYSTVGDLHKWDQSLYTTKLLPKKYLDMMFTQSISLDSVTGYGYGWFLKRIALGNGTDSISIVYHTGTITGYNALIYRVPATQRTFICLNNMLVGRDNLIAMARGCINILYGQRFDRPKASIAATIGGTIISRGMSPALAQYDSLRAQPSTYNLSEEEMNQLGYDLLAEDRPDDAVKILALNVAAFPSSSNVYDSIGDAYVKAGKPQLAMESYKKALAVDPHNSGSAEKLRRLQSK